MEDRCLYYSCATATGTCLYSCDVKLFSDPNGDGNEEMPSLLLLGDILIGVGRRLDVIATPVLPAPTLALLIESLFFISFTYSYSISYTHTRLVHMYRCDISVDRCDISVDRCIVYTCNLL